MVKQILFILISHDSCNTQDVLPKFNCQAKLPSRDWSYLKFKMFAALPFLVFLPAVTVSTLKSGDVGDLGCSSSTGQKTEIGADPGGSVLVPVSGRLSAGLHWARCLCVSRFWWLRTLTPSSTTTAKTSSSSSTRRGAATARTWSLNTRSWERR